MPQAPLYTRLIPEDNTIRILDLLPGSWDDELRGRLRLAALRNIGPDEYWSKHRKPKDSDQRPYTLENFAFISESSVRYEALSYVWGSTTQGRNIDVDGHCIPSTDNLYNALKRLRRRRHVRALWVDAICIDQSDNEEKSSQVARMGKIYSAARSVEVWLGESAKARSVDLRLLLQMYQSRQSVMNTSLEKLMHRTSDTIAAFRELTKTHGNHNSPVLELEWHHRAWTMQEFLLARKVHFHLGSAVTKDTVRAIFYANSDDKLAARLGITQSSGQSMGTRSQALPSSSVLFESMTFFQQSSASDPRDMVYSLLGLLPPDQAQYLLPDYSMSYAKVCAKATYTSLAFTDNASLLSCVNLDGDKEDGLVSWAMEFARPRRRTLKFPISWSMKLYERPDLCVDLSLMLLGYGMDEDLATVTSLPETWAESKPLLSRLVDAITQTDWLNWWYETMLFVAGAACIITTVSGGIGIAPAVIRVGDKLIQFCTIENSDLAAFDMLMVLRPHKDGAGECYTFRGLALMLYENTLEKPTKLESFRIV